MTILALDLGNKFGWATKQKTVSSGWERLTKGKCHPGKKFMLFHYWLQECTYNDITVIYYEDVVRHCSRDNARAYCGYLAILQSYTHKHDIQCRGIGVKQIKKFWTGSGNASKDLMVAEAKRRGFDITQDDEADALAILHCGIAMYHIGEQE